MDRRGVLPGDRRRRRGQSHASRPPFEYPRRLAHPFSTATGDWRAETAPDRDAGDYPRYGRYGRELERLEAQTREPEPGPRRRHRRGRQDRGPPGLRERRRTQMEQDEALARRLQDEGVPAGGADGRRGGGETGRWRIGTPGLGVSGRARSPPVRRRAGSRSGRWRRGNRKWGDGVSGFGSLVGRRGVLIVGRGVPGVLFVAGVSAWTG